METVYADDSTIVVTNGKRIKCYQLKDAQIGDIVWDIKLKKKLSKRGYRIEFCGNWLFICQLSKEQEEDKLIYKINLSTGDVTFMSQSE